MYSKNSGPKRDPSGSANLKVYEKYPNKQTHTHRGNDVLVKQLWKPVI